MIIEKERLIKKLKEIKYDRQEYETVAAKDGGFTVLCRKNSAETYINSKYAPFKSGEQFAKSIYSPENKLVIYGLGLGYHIMALHGMLTDSQKLYVFETNLVTTKIAFEKTGIIDILEKDNVFFYCSDDLRELATELDSIVYENSEQLIIYEPSLKIIPDEMEKLRDVLMEYKSSYDMLRFFSAKMKENKAINTSAGYRDGMELLKSSFEGIPVIMVAAGASLNLNAAELKECRQKAVIVSVTRAANTLSAAGVSPDFYVSADAGSYIDRHLDFGNEKISAPLLLLSTADANARFYRGEKLIVYEKCSAPNSEFCIETGGSVATAALSISVNFGANPVVFVGQDLCYCFEKTHADGYGSKRIPLKASKYVQANDGNSYFTSGGLYVFLKWIERFIKRNRQTNFYNATALGAVIEGAPNVNLSDFFSKYPEIRGVIEEIKKSKKLD